MYASPVLGADGRAEAAFVILADIGEREALERQVREARRMESVGYLAGGIAHQFNNLLTTIVGFSDLAASTLDPDHEAAGHLAEIQQASDRAADLTRRLLAFSRRQTMRPGVFDLALAVAALRPVLQRIAGPDVRLVLEASVTDRFDVHADLTQLQQVIVDLVRNARDAMPNGGVVTLRTSASELDASAPRPRGEDGGPGRYVQLTISDTAGGMSREVADRIFEPFFTTASDGERVGLGLAVAYGIVQQSGGRLVVDAPEGSGATFTITLPASEVPAQAPTDRDRPWAADGGPDADAEAEADASTILLVDDEPSIRTLARRILAGRGYHLVEAADATEAFATAATLPHIDLLLTDIMMPGMNGLQLAERLVADRPDLRVLFISGFGPDDPTDQGWDQRGATLLAKPFTAADLLSAVHRSIAAVAPWG